MSSSVENSHNSPFTLTWGNLPHPFRAQDSVEMRAPTPETPAFPRTPLTPITLHRARSDSNVSYPSTALCLLIVPPNTQEASAESSPKETKLIAN